MRCSAGQVTISARVLVVEAFDDLVRVAARLSSTANGSLPNKTKIRDLVTALLPRMVNHLEHVLQYLDIVTEHATFFARIVTMVANL
eukprot:CAMPEP_0195130018 /NCGR_PEP_ID=MMETSP0448-20130528/142400_1 /TAXON_ID=66468 /ORGANISM="Heterocapsa triquestra, Strain CCMP 448" /LENGTH=86 /DNA_ID=CAMNT_0040167903 /DNA_START=1 /DNA_END=258 /DNA_ORIENTATION=-